MTDEAYLRELARRVEDAHHRITGGSAFVQQAILAGEALIEVRQRVPRGRWEAWIDENTTISKVTANRYVRMATYRDVIGEAPSLVVAQRLLSERPATHGPGSGHPEELKEMARRMLRRKGATVAGVAREIGVSRPTIRDWGKSTRQLKADEQRRVAERAKRQAERRRSKRDATAKRVGGDVAEAYSAIRRATQAIERAHGSQEKPAIRRHLSTALHRAYAAEDEIVKALGLA